MDGWQLLEPTGFSDEKTLQELIAEAPQVLPLSGSPRLVVLGREVPLGSGYADIVGVETTGRPVIIEVKLEKNPEARRAIIAQILAYASSLYRRSMSDLNAALATSFALKNYASVVEAVEAVDQDQSIEPTAFTDALESSLSSGDIRLVLVLDSAPPELIGVVGYLGAIAPNLTLDIIAVSRFKVGEQSAIVPQRIEPGRFEAPALVKSSTASSAPKTTYSFGAEEFDQGIEATADGLQPDLRRLAAWARRLEADGLAKLRTARGQGRWALSPLVTGGDAGLVTLWNERGAAIAVWRSAFQKWAPSALARLESSTPPVTVGNGTYLKDIGDETLGLLRNAYEEAARQPSLPELTTQTRAILIKQAPWSEGEGSELDEGRHGHGYRPGMTEDELYESVRAWWVLDPKRARQYPYAVAVFGGMTRGVWRIDPDSWESWTPRPDKPLRWSFRATSAAADVVEEFVGEHGKRVPKFRTDGSNVFGSGSPIAYWP